MADDKLKILYLMKMLLDETDRDHPMNAAEIAENRTDTLQRGSSIFRDGTHRGELLPHRGCSL